MAFGGSSSGGLRQQQEQDAFDVQKGLTDINQQFAGFTPKFFSGIQDAYTRAAQPQLQQQYKTANNQLGFQLAGKGLEDSSQSQQLGNNLATTMSNAQQQIANQALGQSQNLQKSVAGEKSNLIAQLEASKDPNATALQARESALNLGQVPAFDSNAVSGLFNQFTQNYLGSGAATAYNNYAGSYLNSYNNPSLFQTMNPSSSLGFLPNPSISTH